MRAPGRQRRYAFGDAITPKDANYSESKLDKTTEVGAYPPNAWGLYDMHGNVWEWVEDIFHDSYRGAPTDGSAWTDSKGYNSDRVHRGGSWPDFRGSSVRRSATGADPTTATSISGSGLRGHSIRTLVFTDLPLASLSKKHKVANVH